jgi:hypothetical protein
MKVIKLGAKVQHLVHGKSSTAATKSANARPDIRAAE